MNDVMNSNIDVNHVIQLVNTLYNSKNPDEQNEANRRLTQLQSSDGVWQICWLLLDPDQPQSVEIHFFAANLLVQKINQSWSSQDDDWLENQLRPKLFETLVKYAGSPNGARVVIDKLSLALANFALHSIPTFWPDAIEDILKTFTSTNLPVNIPQDRICDILLKILILIPEEYSVMLPQQEHRAKLNGQITKSGPIVFRFLHTLLVADHSVTSFECRQNLLRCITSWTLNSQTSLLELDDAKTFLDLIFSLIADDELCSSACSTLAASFSTHKADSMVNTVIEYIPKIAELKGIIDKYISEDELEQAIKVYSLVINFSENHARLFLKIVLGEGINLPRERHEITKQAVFAIIRIILDCTGAQGTFCVDEMYSDMAFPFWFAFFENFYFYAESFEEIICDTFDPLVDSLIQTLISKARYPATITYNQVWNDDQRESFRCYRQDVGDNITMIIQFPRARERIFTQLTEQLAQELAAMIQQQVPPGEEKQWQKLESVLFALKSVSESIPYDEETNAPKIFNLLAKMPFNESPPELYCTAAELISAYSDWLFTYSSNLATAFNILFLGVTSSNAHVRLMATLSLKDLTSECQTVLQPYATQITDSCTAAIQQNGHLLNTNEKARLMYTVGTTLAVMPATNVVSALNNLTTPIICELTAKAQCDPMVDPTCRSIILDRLTMLSNLIESLYIKEYSGTDFEDDDENDYRTFDITQLETNELESIQPAIGLLRQLIPILSIISEKYRADEEIMERISNTVKRSAKSLGLELKPVLRDLLSITVNAYDPILSSHILEGSIPLYLVFKVDKTLRDFLRDAFANISDKTLNVCMTNPLRQLSLSVENYFKFTTNICRKFADFLTVHPSPINVELIYKLALASLELPEKRTLTEVCNFITLVRQKCVGSGHMHQVFVGLLDLLFEKIFNIFGGNYNTPRNAIDSVSEMLFVVTDMGEAKEPLNRVVGRNDFPTSHVNRDQKARFVSRLLHERHRRKYKEICSEFVLVARNLSRA